MKKACLWFAVCALGMGLQAEMFKDGDRVVFFGDSITHKGMYLYNVYDYYLTRFPQAKIRFMNAGVSGDNAGACQDRFTVDVADRKPTHVAVMFGMNDVKMPVLCGARVWAAFARAVGSESRPYQNRLLIPAIPKIRVTKSPRRRRRSSMRAHSTPTPLSPTSTTPSRCRAISAGRTARTTPPSSPPTVFRPTFPNPPSSRI